MDVGGHIETVGKDVKQLHTGDEVFGWCSGAFADYASGAENTFVPKPANLTFERAASFPWPLSRPCRRFAMWARYSQGKRY